MTLPIIDELERAASVELLGVVFQDNFEMDMHANFILSQCNQRLYLLKLLGSQGLQFSVTGRPGFSRHHYISVTLCAIDFSPLT